MNREKRDWTLYWLALFGILFLLFLSLLVKKGNAKTIIDISVIQNSPTSYVYTRVANFSKVWDKSITLEQDRLVIVNVLWYNKFYFENEINCNLSNGDGYFIWNFGIYSKINNWWQVDYMAGMCNNHFDLMARNKILFDLWIFKFRNFTDIIVPLGDIPVFRNEASFITGIGKFANIQFNARQLFEYGKFTTPLRLGMYVEF